jgi:hypothetical protein
MRYAKPSIMELGAASVAIQSLNNKVMPKTDGSGATIHPSTGNAYDLDE